MQRRLFMHNAIPPKTIPIFPSCFELSTKNRRWPFIRVKKKMERTSPQIRRVPNRSIRSPSSSRCSHLEFQFLHAIPACYPLVFIDVSGSIWKIVSFAFAHKQPPTIITFAYRCVNIARDLWSFQPRNCRSTLLNWTYVIEFTVLGLATRNLEQRSRTRLDRGDVKRYTIITLDKIKWPDTRAISVKIWENFL